MCFLRVILMIFTAGAERWSTSPVLSWGYRELKPFKERSGHCLSEWECGNWSPGYGLKEMVLWREDAGDWVDLSPFNCAVTPYICFEPIYSVHLLSWARLPLSPSWTTHLFTCILSDIAVLNPGCTLEASGGDERQSWYPTKSDIWVGAQAYVFFFLTVRGIPVCSKEWASLPKVSGSQTMVHVRIN